MIKFDFSSYMGELPQKDNYHSKIEKIKKILKTERNMLDWYTIDRCIPASVLTDIIETSTYVRRNCDIFIVIGIGGSFLGSKAVIDAINPYFSEKKPEILFAGTSLSPTYLEELLEYIVDKEVIVNVISKSGTTLEPSICFDFIYDALKKKYSPNELQNRIIITTDEEAGDLRKFANEKGFKSFEVPRQVGGRYSVLTAVGLLPIAVAGVDINRLVKGARDCDNEKAFEYAIVRDILYKKGKIIESYAVYETKLLYFTEWLKQLFAETQGKNNNGILPVSTINTRDLHSLGQFYQEGNKIIFETVINIVNSSNLFITKYNRKLDDINDIAAHKVALAHYKAGTYSNFISMDKLDEYNLGYLIFFFEVAAAAGGYLLDVDPFDQPGVNAYKDLINEELGQKHE
jgi:glucose-6-phosphate isomerase